MAAALISLWRVLRDLVRWVARQLNKWLKIPRPAASAAGFAVVLVLVFMLVDGILLRVGYGVVNSIFSLQNNETRPGAVQPILPEKSGSPASAAPWDTLGSRAATSSPAVSTPTHSPPPTAHPPRSRSGCTRV